MAMTEFGGARPKVFISYRRSDGEATAHTLLARLEREAPDLDVWMDRGQLQGGRDWWLQIKEAIDSADHLLLVMSEEALESEIVRKEWRYARQQGVCIRPVKATQRLDLGGLPRWMRDMHFYDRDREWDGLIRDLRAPCSTVRVPFMAPDRPAHYVERPDLQEELLGHLLDTKRENPIAATVSVTGPAGAGKSSLVAAMCDHDRIQECFDDGVLWITLGQAPDFLAAVSELHVALTGRKWPFLSLRDATFALAEALADRDCVIVLDDVWEEAHVEPFLSGAERCARLITTRSRSVVPAAVELRVAEMTDGEAISLLLEATPAEDADSATGLELVRRLGCWALMVDLAAGVYRKRRKAGDSRAGALAFLEQAFARHGVVAFDRKNSAKRNEAIERSLQMSLELLDVVQEERLFETGIFPEGVPVPFSVLEELWHTDSLATDELVAELDALSLVTRHLADGTIRLHAFLRGYYIQRLSDPRAVHAALVRSWGDRHKLAREYHWRWIAFHLREACGEDELHRLLTDTKWLQFKLAALTSSSDRGIRSSGYASQGERRPAASLARGCEA